MSPMTLTHTSVSTRHVHLFETSTPDRGSFTTVGIMCCFVLNQRNSKEIRGEGTVTKVQEQGVSRKKRKHDERESPKKCIEKVFPFDTRK